MAKDMNIKCEIAIYILSILAYSGKNYHRHYHHHHHHGNGINYSRRRRRGSKKECIRKILGAMNGEESSDREHAQPLLGDTESALVLPPGVKKTPNGTDFLITESTPDNRPKEYKPAYANSKVYKIMANMDSDVSFILLSSLENYYPQIRISKAAGNSQFKEAVPFFSGPQSSKSYQIKKGESMAIEVGYDGNFDAKPFSNTIRSGGFRLFISLNGKTLESYLDKSKILTSSGFSGAVTIAPGSSLLLSSSWYKNLNHGSLDTKLVPYYNSEKNAITLYYRNGSNYSTGSIYRSSVVEQVCNKSADDTKVTRGTEPSGGRYVWKSVPSKKVCDLGEFLKAFN